MAWFAVVAIWAVVAARVVLAVRAGQIARSLHSVTLGLESISVAIDLRVQRNAAAKAGAVCVVLSALALAAWSHRVATNARARGVPDTNVRVATWAWFLPLFGIRPAIEQLRRYVSAVDCSDHRLVRWLWTAYLNFFVALWLWWDGFTTQVTREERAVLAHYDRQAVITAVIAAWVAICAVAATMAILHADRAVSANS